MRHFMVKHRNVPEMNAYINLTYGNKKQLMLLERNARNKQTTGQLMPIKQTKMENYTNVTHCVYPM